MSKNKRSNTQNSKLILRFDLGAEEASTQSNGSVNFTNIYNKAQKFSNTYGHPIIALLSPFSPVHTEKKPFTKVNKITGIWEGNQLQGSIYAADRLFDEKGEIVFNSNTYGTEQILKDLCVNMKSNGNHIVMYDLVLNHLGSESTQLKELEEKFRKEHGNVILAEVHRPFTDVKAFNYDNKNVREFIFNNLHKPLIDRLVDLGMGGFRIDAAGHVNIEYQKLVAKYLNDQASKQEKKFEIVLEHMKSDKGVSKKECLNTWTQSGLNSNLTTSSFLGTKIAEFEKNWKNGMPSWIEREMHEVDHHTSGMVGNHDEHNLYGKVASLISAQSIYNSDYRNHFQKAIETGEKRDGNKSGDRSIATRQLYNGNNSESNFKKEADTVLHDTSCILTIENQIKILNSQIKGKHEFSGFGEINREDLVQIYRAKSIEISHLQIEMNNQTMICVGPVGDLEGKLGSHSVFSKPEDFPKRLLDIECSCNDISVKSEIISIARSKAENLTLQKKQWLERINIPLSETNPHDFASVVIKHSDNSYYNKDDQIEISYACTKTQISKEEMKTLLINQLRKENRHVGEEITLPIENSKIYNALQYVKSDVTAPRLERVNDNKLIQAIGEVSKALIKNQLQKVKTIEKDQKMQTLKRNKNERTR